MIVRVALVGSTRTGSVAYRYVLDGARARRGSARLTFRGLTPGRHRLLVTLVGQSTVHAVRTFFVRAPLPVANPIPVQTAPAPTTTSMPTPPPTTTVAPPPPPPPSTTTPPPTTTTPPTSGIPQGNGGDKDADNNGGPSDGDGNI